MTRILLRDLTPSSNYAVQFRTRSGGTVSDWSPTLNFTTINDTTAPPVPSTPVVTPYLGQLKVAWDGTGASAEPMPNDFSHVEVHVSTTNGFTPSGSTRYTTLRRGGEAIVSGLTYGTTYYVKLLSQDVVGNQSTASAQASGVPTRVSGIDVAALAIATTHLGDGAVTAAKIQDATITSAKIGTAQILNANIANAAVDDAKIGNVSAGKIITGQLQATTRIIAGVDGQERAEMTGSGLFIYDPGPDGEYTAPVVSLGTAGAGNYFAVSDASGTPVASIDEYGTGSFAGMIIDSYSFMVGGEDFRDIVDRLPRGLKSYATLAGAGPDTANIGTTETILFQGSVGAVQALRFYQLVLTGHMSSATASFTAIPVDLTIRYTTDGTTPTTASTVFHTWRIQMNASGGLDFNVNKIYSPSVDYEQWRFCITMRALSGGTAFIWNSSAGRAMEFSWFDVGLEDNIDAATLTQKSKATGTADPDPVSNFTKTYACSWTGSYYGDGTRRNSSGYIYQGQYSGFAGNGNQKSMIGFPYTTIQSNTAGATIKKCEVYLYFNHWYFNSGGTAVIGTHNSTAASAPTTFSGTTSRVNSANWPKPGGRWVSIGTTIGNEFKNNTAKGIVIGPGDTTGNLYYGYADGFGKPKPPKLRITYSK